MVAAGYTADELMDVMREVVPVRKPTLRFETFLDAPVRKDFTEDDVNNSEILKTFAKGIPTGGKGTLNALLALSKNFRKLFNLNEFGGLYVGKKFDDWLKERLKKTRGDETFETFEAKNGTDLTVVASDTTAQRELILNRRTAPKCPVAKAVRMSMSIPDLARSSLGEGMGPLQRGADGGAEHRCGRRGSSPTSRSTSWRGEPSVDERLGCCASTGPGDSCSTRRGGPRRPAAGRRGPRPPTAKVTRRR